MWADTPRASGRRWRRAVWVHVERVDERRAPHLGPRPPEPRARPLVHGRLRRRVRPRRDARLREPRRPRRRSDGTRPRAVGDVHVLSGAPSSSRTRPRTSSTETSRGPRRASPPPPRTSSSSRRSSPSRPGAGSDARLGRGTFVAGVGRPHRAAFRSFREPGKAGCRGARPRSPRAAPANVLRAGGRRRRGKASLGRPAIRSGK
jgi:hypothetical protein